MLTEILSADYRDIDNEPGPSINDLGSYTKFNYIDFTKANKYKWRSPFSDANYNKGCYSDGKDDNASYVYGTKEIFYLHSIETQTHIAVFYISNRHDSFGPFKEENTSDQIDDNLHLQKLDSICLYTLSDFNSDELHSNLHPIKTIKMDYVYDLCQGIPNSNSNSGKLTLNKVSFIYYNNRKGTLSPYVFSYAHPGIEYNQSYIDRWGNYQSDDLSEKKYNAENPYVDQYEYASNQNKREEAVAAWNLNKIVLPSGGVININYESDDYAYVQNKVAMQMMQVLGTLPNNSSGSLSVSQMSDKIDKDHLRLCFRLENYIAPDSPDELLNYFSPGDTLYFKVFTRLKKDDQSNWAYDYVEGYALVDSGHSGWYGLFSPSNQNSGSDVGYVDLKDVSISVQGISMAKAHPFQKAGWQYLKLRRSDLLYPSQDIDNTNVKQILNIFKSIGTDIGNLLIGYETNCYVNGFCSKMLTNKNQSEYHPSYVRLRTPDLRKYGGGNRVSKITIDDKWGDLSGEASEQYGQTFEYNCSNDGKLISSGVAEYEPLTGADEIPHHKQMIYPGDPKLLSKRDELVIELPIGEQFFPAPKVGYSRVVVKNIKRTNSQQSEINKKSAEGIRVHEFYTSRDFPVITSATHPEYKRSPNWMPAYIPYVGSYSSRGDGYSQGYKIEVNNMPGKQKSIETYAYASNVNSIFSTPITKTEYIYNSIENNYPDKYSRLKNNVDIIDTAGDYKLNAELGVTREFYLDSRETKNNTYTYSEFVDGDIVGIAPAILAILSLWPKIDVLERMTRTIVTNKVINRNGILKEIRQTNNGSKVITKNIAFDAVTGKALLTSLTNEFDKPVYTTEFPAGQTYHQMGSSFQNYRYLFKGSVNSNGVFSPIAGSNTHPIKNGDQVMFLNSSNISIGYFWIDMQGSQEIHLIGRSGTYDAPSNYNTGEPCYLLNLESGFTNQHGIISGDITSLKNPFLDARYPIIEAINNGLGQNNAEILILPCLGTTTNASIHVKENFPNTIVLNQDICNSFQIIINDFNTNGSISSLYGFHFEKEGSHLSLISDNDPQIQYSCVYCDPDYCFPECLDGVLDASISRFASRIEYPASFSITGINDYLKNSKNTFVTNNQKKFFINRKQENINYIDLSKDGTYNSFSFYKYPIEKDTDQLCGNWRRINAIKLHDKNGGETENMDALWNFSSAIYGFNGTLVTAITKNSKFKECAFNSFEEYGDTYTGSSIGNLLLSGSNLLISHSVAHTGKASLQIADNSFIEIKETDPSNLFPPLLYDNKYYLGSFWVKSDENLSIDVMKIVNQTSMLESTLELNKSGKIDDWQKIEFKVKFSCGHDEKNYLRIHIPNTNQGSQTTYIDDFRIHPVEANMVSFVYDPDKQLLQAKLDENNFAMIYIYDEYGKLVQTKRETEKGIYTIKTTKQNLSRIEH